MHFKTFLKKRFKEAALKKQQKYLEYINMFGKINHWKWNVYDTICIYQY